MDATDIYSNVRMDAGGIGAVLDGVKYIRHCPDVLYQANKQIKKRPLWRFFVATIN